MSIISVRLPNSIHQAAKEISQKDRSSLNGFVVAAMAEKIAALKTEEYLKQRGSKGSKKKYQAVLDKVPDVPTEEHDVL